MIVSGGHDEGPITGLQTVDNGLIHPETAA
jgi:hypothetical protein